MGGKFGELHGGIGYNVEEVVAMAQRKHQRIKLSEAKWRHRREVT